MSRTANGFSAFTVADSFTDAFVRRKTRQTAAYRREASRLKRLLTDGIVIEGTLAEVRTGSAVHYQLTRKVRGRTQTDYVPLAMKEDVEELLNPLLVSLLPKEDEDRCVYSLKWRTRHFGIILQAT